MSIQCQRYGGGKPVILLHGFPMNAAVWSGFAPLLSTDYEVIAPDIPGFGASDLLPSPFSLSDVGDAINLFVEHNNLSGAALIGHSLGGYVALEMVSKRPDLFSALGLFHSTALADTPEKKETRTKVVDFIARNGAEAFTSSFIGPLFADPQHPSIETVKEIAAGSPAETVTAYTIAMRDRRDHTATLATLKMPVLFICGEKDGGIPVESIRKQAARCLYPTVRILNGVGHMAMFEEPEGAAKAVHDFLVKNVT